jgi:hypothetical protein
MKKRETEVMKKTRLICVFLGLVLLVSNGATISGSQSSKLPGSKLVSTVVDPEKKMNYTRPSPTEDQSMSVSKNQFNYTITYKDNGVEICSYTMTAVFDAPPENLRQGQEFTLNVQLTCTASGKTRERPFVQSARFDCGGIAGPEMVKSERVWVGQHSQGGPFVPSAQAAFVFKMPTDGYKFYINAVATGCGTVTEYKYEFVEASPVGGAAPADKPLVTAPRPTSAGGTSKNPCAAEKDAWREASVKAQFAFYHLQTVRAMIEDLNREWESRRQAAYWSGTLDVALLAGSVLTKPLAGALGAEIVKQPLQTAIIEAGFKGIVKESLKKFAGYCSEKNLNPSEVLADVFDKGATNAAKKALEEFGANVITEMMMSKILAGEMGGLDGLQVAAAGVDSTMRGGVTPEMSKFLRNEFAAPAAKLAGVLVSLGSAIDGAWTAHGKLENLRIAVKGLRDQEIERTRKWELLTQDLDAALNNYNECLKLHPEARDEPAPSMRRRAGEEAPRSPNVGDGPAVLNSDGTLSLKLMGCRLRLQGNRISIAEFGPADQGASRPEYIIAGAVLKSVFDMTDGRERDAETLTLEELGRILNSSESNAIVVLKFGLPGGDGFDLPHPGRLR